MKNICFESYRQLKKNTFKEFKSKPKKQLDSTWYTDNIYSNPSEDLEYDFIPECLKIDPKLHYELNNMRQDNDVIFLSAIGDEQQYADKRYEKKIKERRGEGEGSSGYGLQRSASCKEFFSSPSKATYKVFESPDYNENLKSDIEVGVPLTKPSRSPTYTIPSLPRPRKVAKSYSFNVTPATAAAKLDSTDYKCRYLDQDRRGSQMPAEPFDYHHRQHMDKNHYPPLWTGYSKYVCCAREYCTNAKCLLSDLHPGSYDYVPATQCTWRHATPPAQELSTSSRDYYRRSVQNAARRKVFPEKDFSADGWHYPSSYTVAGANAEKMFQRECSALPAAVVCCCQYHKQYHHYAMPPRTQLCYPNHIHHPAMEPQREEQPSPIQIAGSGVCPSTAFSDDIDPFMHEDDEEKFLDKTKDYLAGEFPKARQDLNWDLQSHESFEKDSCSDSTELDLIDFNIDLEKYWTELEKPPSPIDLDMQQRNMRSNLKTKDISIECYNNGLPVYLHDREQERLLIKKSLLEGMPSPPQPEFSPVNFNADEDVPNGNSSDNIFSSIRRFRQYGHKVYPTTMEPVPSYQANNNCYGKQQQQPHHNQQQPIQIHEPKNSALNVINNIFSIYKPNKYPSENCHYTKDPKPDPCKKMNIPSTHRPLGVPYLQYMNSMKRPLIVNAEQPHFKIIPEKTGLKISPIFNSTPEYHEKETAQFKFASTARPLLLPH